MVHLRRRAMAEGHGRPACLPENPRVRPPHGSLLRGNRGRGQAESVPEVHVKHGRQAVPGQAHEGRSGQSVHRRGTIRRPPEPDKLPQRNL